MGVILAGILYSLPKTVVNDKDSGLNSAEVVENSNSTSNNEGTHSPQLSLKNKIKADSLKALIRNQEENSEVLMILSELYAAENIYDSAAYYAEKKSVITGSPKDMSLSADLYFQAFSLSLNPVDREELAEKTRDMYGKVLNLIPSDLHARTNTAMTYVTSDSPMQAIMMLRQVLADNPSYVPALMSMGGLSLQSGQNDKALARFQEVLKLDPGNVNAIIGLAFAQIELGDKENAKKNLEMVLKLPLDEVLRQEVVNTLQSLN